MSAAWNGLLANLGIIAIFVSVWAYSLDWTRRLPSGLRALGLAMAGGAGAVVMMALPFEIRPGVYFDLRSVPIALAGFLCGPLVGIAAGVMAALYRLWLGGVGAPGAIVGITFVTLIGVVGHLLLRGRKPGARPLVLLAAATAIGAISGFFFLPDGLWRTVVPQFAVPGMSLIFVAVLMAGAVILSELRRRKSAGENQMYRAVIDALPEPLNAKDPQGRFVAANPAATADLMQAPGAAALIGKTDVDFYPPEIAAIFRKDEETAMESGHSSIIEQRVSRKDGSSAWLSTLKVPLFDKAGAIIGLLTHNRDVTDLKRLEDEHDAAQRTLADALANMADGLAMFDRDDRLVLSNERYREMFSKTAHLRVPGARFRDILRASIDTGEQAGVPLETAEAWIDATVASLHVRGESHIELGDGRWLHSRVRSTGAGGSLCVISDVTTQRDAARKLSELNLRLEALARMDGLTELANRRAFDEVLEKEFLRSARTGAPLSLLLIDVDNFKAFNDAYGHPAGDECLRSIAGALGAALQRPGDLAARYGGEELAAILPETGADGALSLAEVIRSAVSDLAIPHAATASGIVTISLGVATRAGRGGDRAGELVERADEALYAAKAAGRDRVAASRPHLVGSPGGPLRPSPARRHFHG